jgi:hypothetical protein
MGAEPFARAVSEGAEVVIAGRASDTSIFASLPVAWGFSPGLAWHAAKILECGAAAAANRVHGPDCLFVTINHNDFVVEPLAPELRCTPQSVAAHALNENADPFHLTEPSGSADLTDSVYEAIDSRRVRVKGSTFIPAEQYTIKIEGAELVGHQYGVLGSIRDPYILQQLPDFLSRAKAAMMRRAEMVLGSDPGRDFRLDTVIYGQNGTLGAWESADHLAHEVCILFKITANKAETARAIAGLVWNSILHVSIPHWKGAITTFASPFTPAYFDRGSVYKFNANHVVEVNDPFEMFRTEMIEVK